MFPLPCPCLNAPAPQPKKKKKKKKEAEKEKPAKPKPAKADRHRLDSADEYPPSLVSGDSYSSYLRRRSSHKHRHRRLTGENKNYFYLFFPNRWASSPAAADAQAAVWPYDHKSRMLRPTRG
jgi:hypothetical protein